MEDNFSSNNMFLKYEYAANCMCTDCHHRGKSWEREGYLFKGAFGFILKC